MWYLIAIYLNFAEAPLTMAMPYNTAQECEDGRQNVLKRHMPFTDNKKIILTCVEVQNAKAKSRKSKP